MCGDEKAIQDEGECLINVNINVIVVPLGVGQQRRGQSVVAEGPKSASGSLSANGLENIGSAQQVSDAASQREPKNWDTRAPNERRCKQDKLLLPTLRSFQSFV